MDCPTNHLLVESKSIDPSEEVISASYCCDRSNRQTIVRSSAAVEKDNILVALEGISEESSRASQYSKSTHEKVVERQNYLAMLMKLHQGHRSMESVLQTAVRIITEILDSDHCSVCWFNPEAESVSVRATHVRKGANVDVRRAVEAGKVLVNKVRANQAICLSPACVVSREKNEK